MFWLGYRDSNPNYLIQSQACTMTEQDAHGCHRMWSKHTTGILTKRDLHLVRDTAPTR